METPSIKISGGSCPHCGETVGIIMRVSCPQQHDGERYQYNFGYLRCDKCKREWTIKILVNIQ